MITRMTSITRIQKTRIIKGAGVVTRRIEKDQDHKRDIVHIIVEAVEEKNGEAEVERSATEIGAVKDEIWAEAERDEDTEAAVKTEVKINIREVEVEAGKES